MAWLSLIERQRRGPKNLIANTSDSASSVHTHGKFFSKAGQKFFLKAMRLPEVGGTLDFEQKVALCRRFDELKSLHTTGLILTEAQANPVLDLAGQVGLLAMIELAVTPEELTDRRHFAGALSRIAHTAHVFAGRPGLLGYLIDCPIHQDEIRVHGLNVLQRRLRTLIKTIKSRDPHAMAAIKHRPATRALAMLDEDLIYAEVSALDVLELHDFVVSMHNLAEARPVIIEFAHSSPGQDEAVAVAFGTGAAGVVAPPVPVPASSDWLGVRMFKADEVMPFVSLNGTCPPRPARTPMVSVVICAYNAERTMQACMESLRKLDYPNYEVVIVDDGSRDRTAEIAAAFPEFRLIRQPNKGLSVARNVGLHAARGDIIAYTDSDCVVDPHWLTLMMRAMNEGALDGCGGPNYAPHEEGKVQACVAASPGAPCHVLVGEDRAEHLAGCNMIFTKAALLQVGGFEPQFTAAGDDVDICWRMLDASLKLGFCPSAFVWHFRRNTIKAYYGQQRGYGRAEAMLYARYPERFNALGQIKWHGTIPGLARTVPGGSRRRVRWTAARPGLQTVFDPALSVAGFIPQTLEWSIFWVIAAMASYFAGWSVVPALTMQLLGVVWALYYAWHAPLEKCHDSVAARLLVAMLAYTGPMTRTISRYKTLARAMSRTTTDTPARQRPQIDWRGRAIKLAYWNEQYITRDALLDKLLKFFARAGHPAIVDRGWSEYDVELRPDPLTRIYLKTADEEHGGMKIKSHVVARLRMSALGRYGLAGALLATVAALAMGFPEVAFALGALTIAGAVCIASEMVEAGGVVYQAVEACAAELNLIPLGKPRNQFLRDAIVTPIMPPQRESKPVSAELTANSIAD